MSKLLSKWFGGGKKKSDCKEPCCLAKRREHNNHHNNHQTSSIRLENGEGGGGKKSDQTDGKKFSKALTSCPCPDSKKCNDKGGENENLTDPQKPYEEGCYGPQSQSEVDYMPVAMHDTHYNMNHPRRGKALIFNFDKWDNSSVPALDLKPRLGSEKDKNDLSKCLKQLDFEVFTYDNLNNEEFWKVVHEVRQEDHRNRDCIVVAILTHGQNNRIFMRCGTLTPVNLVWEAFEAHMCPTLAAKPKIFIIQACRGAKYDHGTRLNFGSQERIANVPDRDTTDSASFSYVIPNAADIIVAFSCPLGHYSWRHPQEGSWFIQSICKVFNQYGFEKDLNEMLTIVAREVALNKESNTDSITDNKKKQVTSTSSTLIRIIKFQPKKQPPPMAHWIPEHVSNINISDQLQPVIMAEGIVTPEPDDEDSINNGGGGGGDS